MSRWKRIWNLMGRRRWLYGAAIGSLILASALLYVVQYIPTIAIDGVLAQEPAAESRVRTVVDWLGGRDTLRSRLWLLAIAMGGLAAIAGWFTYLRGRWAAIATEEITRDVRDRLFDHLQHLPASYHDRADTGDLVQRCTSDVETLRQFLVSQVVEIGRASFLFVAAFPFMLWIDVRMTLIATCCVPFIVVFSVVFFRRVKTRFKAVDEAEGAMTSTLQENLTGIRVVRAFARQEFEREKFGERNRVHRDLDFQLYRLLAQFWSISDVLCLTQVALVTGVGGYWLLSGTLEVGAYYFFLSAVNMVLWPVRMMGRILADLGKATVAIDRIAEILDVPRESNAELRDEPLAIEGEVRFDDVTFHHGNEAPVLSDVSFTLPRGKTLALLGPSGSGKSTILHLLLRFYDPDSGRIEIDGVSLADIPRKEVRDRVAVVLQEPFLFSKTIGENIRLGRTRASEHEIVEAARTACIDESIREFEEGYDTEVGERGVTLSGGQRQRVALARAMIDEPAILVLDDALSAVDTETESLILDALASRRGRRTTIVIAHRLSTVIHADEILVLDRGRVVERGHHSELMRGGGLYERIWKVQSARPDAEAHTEAAKPRKPESLSKKGGV
ncbi:MAG: ABC transporter ATP-binding protein [Planctomycetota bacterium]